jgi:predicted transcriptional regulator
MRKVGATASGSVIIEMSPIQYEALQRAMEDDPLPRKQSLRVPEAPLRNGSADHQKLDFVRNCALKLKLSTVEDLVRSIKTAGSATRGLDDHEIRQLIRVLEEEGLLSIGENGRLTYRRMHPVES